MLTPTSAVKVTPLAWTEHNFKGCIHTYLAYSSVRSPFEVNLPPAGADAIRVCGCLLPSNSNPYNNHLVMIILKVGIIMVKIIVILIRMLKETVIIMRMYNSNNNSNNDYKYNINVNDNDNLTMMI